MTARLLARDALPEHGELRAYRLEDGASLLVEVLREADGRAWQLRLPLSERPAVTRLLRETGRSLRAPQALEFDVSGGAMVAKAMLGPVDELASVALEQGEERAFALWRREHLRSGWSWTIDVALVPMTFALALCDFVEKALIASEKPEAETAVGSLSQ